MLKKIFLMVFLIFMNNAFAQTAFNNKEIATNFFNAIVNEKDFSKAKIYLGPYYTEHDPQGMDGAYGLETYINFLKKNYPDAIVKIKRIIVDNDYVLFHVHSILIPNSKGQAIIDMFRLENGKVVEHWDVTQDIPDQSANNNGMF